MSWENILKTEDKLTAWMEEWQEAKKQLDEKYMAEYKKIRHSLLSNAPLATQSSRNLRRKHPHTGRKRQPIELTNEERGKRDMSDPKEVRD